MPWNDVVRPRAGQRLVRRRTPQSVTGTRHSLGSSLAGRLRSARPTPIPRSRPTGANTAAARNIHHTGSPIGAGSDRKLMQPQTAPAMELSASPTTDHRSTTRIRQPPKAPSDQANATTVCRNSHATERPSENLPRKSKPANAQQRRPRGADRAAPIKGLSNEVRPRSIPASPLQPLPFTAGSQPRN